MRARVVTQLFYKKKINKQKKTEHETFENMLKKNYFTVFESCLHV